VHCHSWAARKQFEHQLAPRLVFPPHPFRPVCLGRYGGERRALHRRVHRAVDRPVHSCGSLGDWQGRDQVADPPARHRVGLGKRLAIDQPIAQCCDCQCRDERPVVKDDVIIRFIGKHEQIVSCGNFPKSFQLIALIDDTGRVTRVAEDDHLRADGGSRDGIEVEMKIGGRGDEDRLCADQLQEIGVE